MTVASAKEAPLSRGSTIGYYDTNAQTYAKETVATNVRALYTQFLRYIPNSGSILDAGSGSGRDTLEFKRRGFHVEAFDASYALAKISSDLTGTPTKVVAFEDYTSDHLFDGVWACASLLHVRMKELRSSLARLLSVIRIGGAIYMSFKYGPGERTMADGRHYTDFDERSLRKFLEQFPNLDVKEIWFTEGEGNFSGRGRWINCIAERIAP